ncbi:MAG: hypothetical protein QGH42_05145 [Kiritimatiellia bacterium]|nr:hypothetical protein [Kiritimatiellia bacterium]MDP6810166.1 hypothetical protein [Kiritimatiellia bacterium]MDP7023616.1 hypothetical protein [Kiritimatiellia bacterium]
MKTMTVWLMLGLCLMTTVCVGGEGRFLSRVHGGGYLEFHANQQDAFDEDRYISEGALEADLFLLRFTPRTHLVWRITCATGMGEATTSGLPFSVQEVRYALIPFVEYSGQTLLVRVGLDHGCDHLILKDTEDPWYVRNGRQMLRDVYDNRLFAGVGSTTYRRATWKQDERGSNRSAPNWIHYAEAGYYLQEFFGAVDEEALNEGNNWWWDFVYDLRCRLWDGSAGDLFVLNRLHVLLDRNSDLYWRETVGIEYQPSGTELGTAFALSWQPVDEHVRDSKEGLIALTGRFFF